MKPPCHLLLLISCFSIVTGIFAPVIQAANTFQPEALWPQLTQSGRYFNFPDSIARGAQGLFYITDSGSHRIKVLTAQGELLRSWGGFGSAAGQFDKPTGIAITSSGEVVIVDFNNSRIQVFDSDGQFLRQWGSRGSADGQLDHPTNVAIDQQGLIYVSDTWNHRVQVFDKSGLWLQTIGDSVLSNPKGIAFNSDGELYIAEGSDHHRISIFTADGQYLRSFGEQGSEQGQFDSPQGLAFDAQGLLYVTEYTNNRIQVFNAQDQWVRAWGKLGHTGPDLWIPFGLLVNQENNTVYVADSSNNRIQHYNLQGNYQESWQSQSSELGEFSFPRASVSPRGEIYVADHDNHRIQVFSPSGEYRRSFGEFGSEPGQFYSPAFIAFDQQNRVYVSDLANDRIQVFDQQDRYLSHWGVSGNGEKQLNGPSYSFIHDNLIYISDFFNHRVQVFTLDSLWIRGWGGQGIDAGLFNRPSGIVVDNANEIYVTDRKNHRIQVFDSSGLFLRQWGTEGSNPGELNHPTGLSLSPDGLLYVADTWNNRIQAFQRDGTFVGIIGEAGTQPSQFAQPYSVDFIDEETLVVGELSNNRVQVLRRRSSEVIPFKAVLLAGGGPSTETYFNPLWDATQLLSNNAYFALRAQGYNKDAIKFLSSGNLQNDLDENGKADDLQAASLASLEQAITAWANDAEDVLIYLIDHGGPGTFKINQNEILSREQLTLWVNRLQSQISGKVTVIIEACQSASFFTGMGAENRFLIASADKQQPAVISNQGMNAFSYYFWYAIHTGHPLQQAFKKARQGMSQQTTLVNNQPQQQNAQLDADGNGLFDSRDYSALGDYCLGLCKTLAADEPQLTPLTTSTHLNGESHYSLSVQVSSLSPLSRVWATISRPDINYTDVNEPIADLPQINLQCSEQGAGQYHCQGEYREFDVNGAYSITFNAQDTKARISVPNAVITIEQVAGKENSIKQANYSASYDLSTGTVQLYDVEVEGQHYQATLLPQNDQFKVTSVTAASQLFSKAGKFDLDSKQLVIPEIQVLDHYYLATLQQQDNGLFKVITVIDLGLVQ